MCKCCTTIVNEYHGVNRAMNYQETDEEKTREGHDHFFAERTRQKSSKPIHSVASGRVCICIKIPPEALLNNVKKEF
jgi:hypothetical protein